MADEAAGMADFVPAYTSALRQIVREAVQAEFTELFHKERLHFKADLERLFNQYSGSGLWCGKTGDDDFGEGKGVDVLATSSSPSGRARRRSFLRGCGLGQIEEVRQSRARAVRFSNDMVAEESEEIEAAAPTTRKFRKSHHASHGDESPRVDANPSGPRRSVIDANPSGRRRSVKEESAPKWCEPRAGRKSCRFGDLIDNQAAGQESSNKRVSNSNSLAKSHVVAAEADHDVHPCNEVGSIASTTSMSSVVPVSEEADDSEDSPRRLNSGLSSTSLNFEPTSRFKRDSTEDSHWYYTYGKRILQSTAFDYLIGGFIILNAALVGAQTDHMVNHINTHIPIHFRIAEVAFCVIFTMELVFRVSVYGRRFLFMPEWKWNLFDLVAVSMQLVEECGLQFMPTKLNVVRVLRILRLVRIIRLVRLLRFVQELRTMVCSIANSFRSLCWTIVLLILMVYIVSVYFLQLIADHGQINPAVYEDSAALRRSFGSLSLSVLSLFQAITGGLNWRDLVEPLMAEISPMLAVVFSLYICFAVLAMMNVITGVFVESALKAAKADRDNDLQSQLHELFLKIDSDQSGCISWEEFAGSLDDPQLQAYFKALEIDPSEAMGLFALLDVSDSGEINVEEFVLGCLRLRGQAQAIDLATLTYFNKRTSARWRAHATRVEAALESIIESLPESAQSQSGKTNIRDQPVVDRASVCHPTLLTANSGTGLGDDDFATWAELKAEGEARKSSRKHLLSRSSSALSSSEGAVASGRKRAPSTTFSFQQPLSSNPKDRALARSRSLDSSVLQSTSEVCGRSSQSSSQVAASISEPEDSD